MLFPCTSCGKLISSKRDACVYCKIDVSQYAAQFDKMRSARGEPVKEKNTGAFLSFFLKTKV